MASSALKDAINEKGKQGAPASDMSKLIHAVYGIDHYPNYLHKWSPEGLADLHDLLRRQLEAVEAAQGFVARRNEVMRRYALKDAELAADAVFTAAINPDVMEAVRRRSMRRVLAVVEEVVPEDPAFCTRVMEEAQAFVEFRTAQKVHLEGFHGGNVVLDHCGLSGLSDALFTRVVKPLAGMLYAHIVRGDLDWRFPYVIGYADKATVADGEPLARRSALRVHTDDSEVTLNVCLGTEGFTGGHVCFQGLRSSPGEGTVEVEVAPVVGRAVLHLGQHLHAVTEVTAGERLMLIMWTRSSTERGMACPCCLMHRRTTWCVCGPEWN